MVSKAQNPFIRNNFTADPSARVFNERIYVYPSHDIPCGPGQGFIGFCMKDYHVYSSENLVEWTDHGVILSHEEVPWVDTSAYAMWAPDCIEFRGKYYFFFPAVAKDTGECYGRRIGVAVAEHPAGPYLPKSHYIHGICGIDPNIFIDSNGRIFIYWAAHSALYVAQLAENMTELKTSPEVVGNLPEGFKEGPFLFERNGLFYFTFPHVKNKTEELAYATAPSPAGPFTYQGVIMDESPSGCWTNHHSILEYQDQWYLFYHHNDLSPEFDKNRSIRVDSLSFDSEGKIVKVTPTLRGVGISDACQPVQVDRYSEISDHGVELDFLNAHNRSAGWAVAVNTRDAWVKYNRVSFQHVKSGKLMIRACSPKSGKLLICTGSPTGPIVAEVEIPATDDWISIESRLSEIPEGVADLVVVSDSPNPVWIDWIRFE